MVEQLDDNAKCSREWNGNDRVNQHYLGRVRLKETPLDIMLYWKKDDNSPRKMIGAYRLDLKSLLKAGYIREVKGDLGKAILRFQRADGGKIQIAVNTQGRALTIGVWKE
jgi:hypothetical protein